MKEVPLIGGVGSAALFGVMWVINRRIEMKRQKPDAGKDEA